MGYSIHKNILILTLFVLGLFGCEQQQLQPPADAQDRSSRGLTGTEEEEVTPTPKVKKETTSSETEEEETETTTSTTTATGTTTTTTTSTSRTTATATTTASPIPAGITVTSSALTTTEAGGTVTFTVKLNTAPTANVTIALSSSDTTEGTVSPATLTFTTSNYGTNQTVTVTGVDDSTNDGNISYTVVIAAAVSTDTNYNGLNPTDLTLSNTDNDIPGFTLTSISGNTTEGGGTATFTMKLNLQPSANVTVGLTSSDTTEGTVSPSSLTFTSGNWNTAQTVTVTGVDDYLDDADVSYSIVTAAATSSDTAYNGLNPSDVSVITTDDDTYGFTIGSISGATTEAGGTATFTVKLSSLPTASVTIGLTSSNTAEGTVSPSSLTFTTGNWSTNQTVTVTGVDDNVDDGDQSYSIVTAAATSSDSQYNTYNPADVTVSNTDNDTAGFTISAISGSTTEAGGTATFTVKLSSQPSANVSIGLTSSDTTEGTVSPSSLTFTTSNWNTNQTVTVTGVNDSDTDGSVSYSIVTAAATSSDSTYNAINPSDVSVTNSDDDMTTGLIYLGGAHSCTVSNGAARCWGRNSSYNLGDNTTDNAPYAITPQGLASGVTAVFASMNRGSGPGAWDHSTCAIVSGAAKCWGANSYYNLGDGTNTTRGTPVQVSGLTSNVTNMSLGNYHGCAVVNGGAKCWGNNGTGQIGDSTTTNRSTPVDVTGLTSGVSAIAAGENHTCALTTSGGVKCWGYNSSGQLGNGTTNDSNSPVDVSGLTSGVSAISVGFCNSCALLSTGAVKCWGYNNSSQLGDGTTTNRSTPTAVTGISSGATSISIQYYHACAVVSGAAKCWGYNGNYALGDGSNSSSSTPVQVSGLTSGVSAISAGGMHSCALMTSGTVKCWGYNSSNYYSVGDGSNTDRSTPVDIPVNPLAAHWKLNDNTATTAVVNNTNTNFNGTASRNVSLMTTTGKIGSALSFNGSSDYVNVPDTTTYFNNAANDFSIAFWFNSNATSNNYPTIITTTGGWSSGSFAIRHNANGQDLKVKVFWNPNGDPWLTSSSTFALSTWHYVVFVRSGNNFSLYVDDMTTPQATATTSGSINLGYGNAVVLGTSPWDGAHGYYNGSLDDVRIYKGKALSSTERAALYNSGNGTESE